MALIKDVLLKASEGKTIADISKELGIGEATLRAMWEFLVESGYVEEIDCGMGCAMCPLKCKAPTNIKMYILTQKGKEYIKG